MSETESSPQQPAKPKYPAAPLPVPGLEYWGLEAQVRFGVLLQLCKPNDIHVEVMFAGWNGPIRGKLRFYTYPDDYKHESMRGDSVPCIGNTSIKHDQYKVAYLRPLIIDEALQGRPAALPGSMKGMAGSEAPTGASFSTSWDPSASGWSSSQSSDSGTGLLTLATAMATFSALNG